MLSEALSRLTESEYEGLADDDRFGGTREYRIGKYQFRYDMDSESVRVNGQPTYMLSTQKLKEIAQTICTPAQLAEAEEDIAGSTISQDRRHYIASAAYQIAILHALEQNDLPFTMITQEELDAEGPLRDPY